MCGQTNPRQRRDVLLGGLPILISTLVLQTVFLLFSIGSTSGIYNKCPCDILRKLNQTLTGLCPSGRREARFKQVCVQEQNHTVFTLQTVCAQSCWLTHCFITTNTHQSRLANG